MKRKVKVKVKNDIDPSIQKIFASQFTGDDIDPAIATDKYDNLYNLLSKLVNLIYESMFKTLNNYYPNDYIKIKQEILEFKNYSVNELATLKLLPQEKVISNKEDLKKINANKKMLADYANKLIQKYDSEKLKYYYLQLKECSTTQALLALYREIKILLKTEFDNSGKDCLVDKNNLSDEWIRNALGSELKIYGDICNLDLKELWQRENKDVQRRFLYTFWLLINDCAKVHEILTTPDIDVDTMVDYIIEKIRESKKRIRGCNLAFRKILNSVNLLRSNFNSYYKEYSITKDPTSIVQNFVFDVSENEGNADKKVILQFKRIAKFFGQNERVQKSSMAQKFIKTINEKIDECEEQIDKENPKKKDPPDEVDNTDEWSKHVKLGLSKHFK